MAFELKRLTLVALAAALACERQAARVSQRDTSAAVAAAAADTIVRRVVRVSRRAASAMQRATGAVRPRRALEPLDSILAVRVFDQRGAEMAGVSVRWTLRNAGDGAQLRVINARTDSIGLSRVAFTPGRSADAQGVVAEVADVGRIDFAISVPVTAIRVVVETHDMWAGDEQSLGAELKDAGGNELTGSPLSWTTTDTSVLRISSRDPLRPRVRGVLAGTASIVGWSGEVRGYARVNVKPVVSGRFMTIDGTPIPPMRMEIHAGAARDSIAVDDGQFLERVDVPLGAEVELRASAIEGSTYHPVHLRLTHPRDLQNLRIALVPTSWRIDAGTYEGRDVPIDAAHAMRRTASRGAFWRLVPISGHGPRKILGWSESDLPLRVAFNRDRSSERIAPEDSVAFWNIVTQMERDLGASVFVPADARADSGRSNLALVEISSQTSDGHTFLSFGQSGDARDGVMLFRHATTMREPHVVTHELLHLLGFGHSASWPTVAEAVGGRLSRLTPEDVAYVQLAMRLRRLQHGTGARPGLPLARQ